MSKQLALFAGIIIFLGGTVPAQSEADVINEARRRVNAPPGATRIKSPVTVPLVGTRSLPLIEVKLNGKGPYRLLVDTAANVTMLQMRVADELGLRVLRPGDNSKLVELRSLQIGEAYFDDLVVGARSWKENIDGIIGFSVFADCLFSIDFPRQSMTLRTGSLPAANGRDVFSYSLDNRSPTLEIMIGNERFNILVDTGAAQGLVVPKATAAKLKFTGGGLRPGPVLSTFETAASRSDTGKLADTIKIGIHEIEGLTVHVWEDVPVLGCGLFKDFVLTFDQKNRTMKVGV